MTLKEDWGAHAGAGGGAEDAAGDGKLNLSWTKYFPACSTQPWQLEGALNTLFEDDQVAIDAIAAKIMGFDPLAIPYLRLCHERGLGVGDPREIEIVGDDVAGVSMSFQTRRSLVIWGDQLIRRGPLRPLKRLLLHWPLMVWAPFASNVYHDLLWNPTIGRARIRAFGETAWGRLFEGY